MRRAAKRDLSEAVIVMALKQAGFSVQPVSGKDCPDLVLAKGGIDRWAEVKTGKAKLKPGQVEWAAAWRGAKPLVLRGLEDVARVIQEWPR